MYDVGAITRAIQTQLGVACPPGVSPARCTNNATPENIGMLLAELREVTDALGQEVARVGLPPLSMVGWATSVSAWRKRLDAYDAIVAAAPPGDRQFIMHDVTMPLVFGLYPGQAERRPADMGTPFALANQEQVNDEFRDELWELFLQDLKDNAADIVKPLGASVGAGAALFVGGILLALMLRR